ncbi:protein ATP6V1FNB-like [Paramacrobiotus metropolitanus]|uniref:protein ATP6V1FNB-like n=1 Tax=Paramacrobiotus metropolitanus TaxID=2943436 RepID=UPI0024464004|nr:protein ATP6V1FNB-like [Paramacrobiotus metropolitanus]
MYKQQPRDVRKLYFQEAQIEHDRIISRAWQSKYGRLLDEQTERIGTVNVVKPGWWKEADYNISDSAKIARDITVLLPRINYPPRVRRFPPHQPPGPEVTEHIPPLSLQYPVPATEKAPLTEYHGRFQYLKNRWALPMNQRFIVPPNVNGEYGWENAGQAGKSHEETPKNFGVRPVLAREFYRQTGVVNHKESKVKLDLSAR